MVIRLRDEKDEMQEMMCQLRGDHVPDPEMIQEDYEQVDDPDLVQPPEPPHEGKACTSKDIIADPWRNRSVELCKEVQELLKELLQARAGTVCANETQARAQLQHEQEAEARAQKKQLQHEAGARAQLQHEAEARAQLLCDEAEARAQLLNGVDLAAQVARAEEERGALRRECTARAAALEDLRRLCLFSRHIILYQDAAHRATSNRAKYYYFHLLRFHIYQTLTFYNYMNYVEKLYLYCGGLVLFICYRQICHQKRVICDQQRVICEWEVTYEEKEAELGQERSLRLSEQLSPPL